jgi:hypothetical protein
VIGTGIPAWAEQCRVGAIADLTQLENEPNCLGLNIRLNTPIRLNFSQTAVYDQRGELVRALLRFHSA